MNRTREDFCRLLLDDSPREALDPERLAARFVRYFDVPARPTMEQIKALLKRAGFGEVSGRRHLDVKGIHYSAPGGGYDIHYREDLWAGTQDYSVVHETYEIIYETLCDMDSGSPPDRIVCTQAERFAAAVLMQPRAFEPLALEWGLDVLKLQRAFLCSYAAVTIRLAEVLRRGDLSLRDVTRRIGISSSYLSQIERSGRKPGSNMIGKLAALYNVDEQELMKRAGRVDQPDPNGGEAMEIERAYQYVLADPVFRVGTRPDGPITLKTKRFIVEMYERFANKRLLE